MKETITTDNRILCEIELKKIYDMGVRYSREVFAPSSDHKLEPPPPEHERSPI